MLVSCIMPTYNRREFIPLAIRSYLHQDWPEKELIVVADGEDVTDLFVGVPNVTYIFRDEHESLGRKKNIGNEFASGEIIAHFDDDDWSGPGRLTDHVNRILSSNLPVTGYNILNFWDMKRNEACQYNGGKGYACDSSLCYKREYWHSHRFKEDLGNKEDSHFAHRAGKAGLLSTAYSADFLVAINHGSNTSSTGPRPFPKVPRETIPSRFFEDIACLQTLAT
jgi:glycosyltransferase involved in cell wall biosynthesis